MTPVVYKGEIVFVRLLLPVVIGIVFAIVFPGSVFVYRSSLILCVLLTSVLLFLGIKYSDFKIYRLKWLPGIVVHVLLALLSYSFTLQKFPQVDKSHFSRLKGEAIVATINSEPKFSGGIFRFEAKISQVLKDNTFHSSTGKLLIALKADSLKKSRFYYGDELLIPYKFNEVDPPFNPNEYNFKKYLANQGIYHQSFINANELTILEQEKGNLILGFAQKLRRRMVEGFIKFIPGKDASALASTLILGYRADLSPELLNAYSKTGTMHVLSVSGMHVALVLLILTKLLGFMDKHKKLKIIKAALVIVLIWLYSLITGFSPSVCRAALMISLLIIGKTRNRRANSYNIIAASALLLLIYNPYFLLDAGFQLSYLAVLGLIYLYPKIYHLFYIKNWLLDKIWSYTALSVAAQIATAPLGIFYFHQFPVYFLLSNLFVVLPISIIMYVGIAFLILYSFAGTSSLIFYTLKFLGLFLGLSIEWVNSGLFYIENLPFATISFFHHGFLYYLFMFGSILLTVVAFQLRKKRFLYASLAMSFLLLSYNSYSIIERKQQEVITFYSLRKSMAMSILSGNKAYLFSNLENDHKTFNFSVKPHLTAFADTIKVLSGKKKLKDDAYFYDTFIQYKNCKILIWDKSINNYVYKKPIKVNFVLITGNPKVKLSKIATSAKCSTILIDGTNKDYRIKQWQDEARKLKIACYVLKKNPAYSINLITDPGRKL